MPHDYTPFVGREYQPPFGCFELVRQVFTECYGIDLGGLTDGLANTPEAKLRALHSHLARYGQQVTEPAEGDVILIRSHPAHVGVVIEPGWMLHNYSGGTSCVEPYTEMRWRNRVLGFWRYRP